MEGCQARGQIGAVAAGHRQLQPRRILNPVSKARDQTCNLMVPSRIRFHCATTGTPKTYLRPQILKYLPRELGFLSFSNFVVLVLYVTKEQGSPDKQSMRQ